MLCYWLLLVLLIYRLRTPALLNDHISRGLKYALKRTFYRFWPFEPLNGQQLRPQWKHRWFMLRDFQGTSKHDHQQPWQMHQIGFFATRTLSRDRNYFPSHHLVFEATSIHSFAPQYASIWCPLLSSLVEFPPPLSACSPQDKLDLRANQGRTPRNPLRP